MDKKEQIIKSALNLFCVKGFTETDIDSVAKRAGVGKGTVYLYFKDKKDLFISSTTFALTYFNNEIEKKVKEGKTSKEKLKIYIDYSFSILTINKAITRLFITEIIETIRKCGEKKALFSRSIFMKRFKILTEIIKKGIESKEFKKVDVEYTGMMIMGGIHILMTKYLIILNNEKVNKKELIKYRNNVLEIINKEKK